MSQPWETVSVKCEHCGRTFRTPAGRRRREWRLGIEKPDFCSRGCNALFVSTRGRQAQEELEKKKIKP